MVASPRIGRSGSPCSSQVRAWVCLVAAGLLEIVWATALKQTDGFTKIGPSVLTIGAAAASFALLSLALRTLPVGTAYAVWVGKGACGVALVGIVALGESSSIPRLACLAMILAGSIGLRMFEG
jgi:quaternary ammonium compound-resistance protein SugE